MSASTVAALLRDPSGAARIGDWAAVTTAARAESLLATLAWRLAGRALPDAVARQLATARADADHNRRLALWEAEMARRALAPAGIVPVLLKGTAYAAAGLTPAEGRGIGDLDILIARADLPAAEAALIGAGWEWVKPDPYDDLYYRRWMHELPPLIHRERDRMIDVHHTILPLTARVTPDAAALIDGAVPAGAGLRRLGDADMVVHAAAHLLADGDLAGGLRNLWDIACLLGELDMSGVPERAARHGLSDAVALAVRLAHRIYGAPLVDGLERRTGLPDRLCAARMMARDGWGRPTRPGLRLAFYLRSHWLRMPPAMLARHLWIKARRTG